MGAELRGLREVRGSRAASCVQYRGRWGRVSGMPSPGSAAPASETLALLSALLTGNWALADASNPVHQREGSGLVAAFLQWHLERGVRSLPMVERA